MKQQILAKKEYTETLTDAERRKNGTLRQKRILAQNMDKTGNRIIKKM